MIKKRPILSISLLASNRMDTLPRCLDSLKPLMEKLDCELIIVDTSGVSEIHELLLTYTDKVETFTWCNDFSKARNVGLKKATGEWFMFLDDDEWLVDDEKLADFFLSGEYKSYGCANYIVRNFYDVNYRYYGESLASRVIKLDKDTEFRSKIHEYLYPVRGNCKMLDVRVYHTGYIYATEEAKRKHYERNVSLLHEMLKEEPDNLRWQTQLAQEYRSVREFDKLEAHCVKYLGKNKHCTRKADALQVMTLYTGHIMSLVMQERYEDTVNACKTLLEDKRCVELAVAMAYLNLAEISYLHKKFEDAINYAWKYLKVRKSLLKKPKELLEQKAALILTETLEDVRVNKIYVIMICSGLELGNRTYLDKYYHKLEWYKETVYVYADTEVCILNALVEPFDEKMLTVVLGDGFRNSDLRARMMKWVQDWEAKDKAIFKRLLCLVKKLDFKGWYKPYATLLTLTGEETEEEIIMEAVSLVQQISNVFHFPEEIVQVLREHGIHSAELYKAVSFETWKESLIEWMKTASWNDVEKMKAHLESSSFIEDVRFGYFMIVYTEQKIIRNVNKGFHVDTYSQLLLEFSRYTCNTYNNMYGETLQKMEIEQLPGNYQAAMWLNIFFEEINRNLKGALACLGKVVDAYPLFAEPMKYYLFLIKTEILDR